MLNSNIKEDKNTNLAPLWDFSGEYGKNIIFKNLKQCFLSTFNQFLCNYSKRTIEQFNAFMTGQIQNIKTRGNIEISYWENEKLTILNYTKKRAIEELIKSKKINEKISQINSFISGFC